VGWVLLVIVAMGVLGGTKEKKSPYPKTRHECPKCHQKTAVKLRRRNNDNHRTFYYVTRCLNPDCRYDEDTEKKKADSNWMCIYFCNHSLLCNSNKINY
jgi:ssDNA-binding Zn-finger/Zn-ribbon topoisomerase 1